MSVEVPSPQEIKNQAFDQIAMISSLERLRDVIAEGMEKI
jgi:hypothetical protein